jgi:RND family efflux transporter MFP subunit
MKRALAGVLKALLPLIIIAAAGLGAVRMIMNRPPVETQTPVIEPPGVRVHEVSLRNAPLTVTSQGTVQPRTESQLVPEIAGRVTWVAPSFAEGGFFEADDVLVKIDPFDYEQALVSARSQLAQARLRLAEEEAEAEIAQREWNTLGRGDPRELALRKPQLEDARASVAAAEAGVERATRDLQRAEIVAPYAGRVRTKNVDIGQYVRVGDTLATVYAVDVAEIRLPLPDDELAYLDLPLSYRGMEPQVQPAVTLRATFAGETHAWNGSIVRTESEIDSVSRMVHAIAAVDDPYAPGPNPNRPPLAVGMYVEATIAGRTARNVAVLPRQALRGRDEVLVVTPDDRLTFRTIDVLRTSTESVIVRAGLQIGELVVISPLDTPTDGMRVQLAGADPDLLERRAAAARESVVPANGAPTSVATANARIASPDQPSGDVPDATDATIETLAAAAPPAADTVATGAPERAAIVPVEPPATREEMFATAAGDSADRPAWLQSILQEGPAPPGAPPRRASRAQRPAVADREARLTTRVRRASPRRDGAPDVSLAPRPVVPPVASAQPARADTPTATSPAATTVAVALTHLNQGSGDDGLGPALNRAVAARLAAAGDLTVADEPAARYVVHGGIQQVGALVRVTARIVDTESDAVLHAAKVDGTSHDRPALEARVADLVIDSLSATTSSSGPPPSISGAAPAGTTRNAPAGATRSALAVLPFDDLSAGSTRDLDVDLGTAITEAIAEEVAAVRGVALVTLDDEAAWAIGGGIQRVGSMVRVTARLTDVSSGTVITAIKVDGTVEELTDLQSRVAAVMVESVRDALAGESMARSDRGSRRARRPEGRRS